MQRETFCPVPLENRDLETNLLPSCSCVFRKVLIIHCIVVVFLCYFNFLCKAAFFERTVVAAFDFKNCTIVHCEIVA